MKMLPVVFDWKEVHDEDGVVLLAMVPQERYRKVALRQFAAGEEYPMIVLEARSRASHAQYFAEIGESFKNLPEDLAPRFPSAEHLRKWCLIETGWCSEKESDWETKRDAMRYVAFVRETVDEYARITVHRNSDRSTKVIVRQAKSQSTAAMGKAMFEESKHAVLDLITSMIGVKRSELRKQAGRSA